MTNYPRAAATAKRLIEANGRTVTLRKENRLPADNSKPWRGPDTTAAPDVSEGGASLTVLACFVGVSGTSLGKRAKDVADASLKDLQSVALVASSSLSGTPDLSQFDTLIDGSQIYRIIATEELRPSTLSIMWELGLAR